MLVLVLFPLKPKAGTSIAINLLGLERRLRQARRGAFILDFTSGFSGRVTRAPPTFENRCLDLFIRGPAIPSCFAHHCSPPFIRVLSRRAPRRVWWGVLGGAAMTILPKKKPPPPDADPANEPPPPGPLPPAPRRGGGVGVGGGGTGVGGSDRDRDSGVGARPRASPPPQGPLPGPPGALHRWALAVQPGAVAGPRPQQASPPPCGGPGGPGGGPGDALGATATGVGAAGVVVGVGSAVGVGGCCSGPGHSKRRRQAPGVGAVGGASPEREEVGAGYNSEDEYEAAAARIEAMDPATVEQVWAGG